MAETKVTVTKSGGNLHVEPMGRTHILVVASPDCFTIRRGSNAVSLNKEEWELLKPYMDRWANTGRFDDPPKPRPFTCDELTKIIGRVVKKGSGHAGMITGIEYGASHHINVSVYVGGIGTLSPERLLEAFTFLDGSPCGVVENK